ncbi:putative clathrin assembly protein At1g14910 isoform X2 [Physcomitrium patens]|uniref:putative clathrin assembly protein At1g14910 isoform X2 n=1 Tax=Physcomitrium patens TaxID=3218 RepID=UPI000D171348|nr:putative clathrin assembly protein At1g14910 [Physcomitrium patens]XP_024375492.1 putative clathrin assembly protein At1g14910 [Physcomitrium patens]|eukprot:XP_024375491.1 putative clathrin assembly protein At1g14910 [Physcomitrella patens]
MSSSSSLRKVIGSIKDTTKVGVIALNSDYKELEIAVVKATSHVECPPKEKHVRTIFLATSSSRPRADVAYCIHKLARRIAKTHTWTVALKSMMVIHRTLREGDPTFRDELLNYARNRGHVLNLSNFKDDSNPSAWDYSAWVRTYALYLEERLECCRVLKYDVEAERTSNHSRTRELGTDELLEHLPALQQLLHRLMNCQPEGAAISNYVIQAALSLCLKESFKIYRAINDGIINLVDKFFEMTRNYSINALEIYKRATLQAARLVEFFEMCKGLDFARNFQFPHLEQPPKSFLYTMEDYIRDAPRIQEEVDERYPKMLTASGYTSNDGATPPAVQPMAEEFFTPPRSVEWDLMELNDVLQAENNSSNSGLYSPSTAQPPQVTGWELALVSNLGTRAASASAPSDRVSGFDKQLLNSLYDDAMQRTFQAAGTQNSASPVSSGSTNPFEDIIFASSNYALASPVAHRDPFLRQQQQQHRLSRMSNNNPPPSGNNPWGLSPVRSPQSSTSPPPQLALPPPSKYQREGGYFDSNSLRIPNLL